MLLLLCGAAAVEPPSLELTVEELAAVEEGSVAEEVVMDEAAVAEVRCPLRNP